MKQWTLLWAVSLTVLGLALPDAATRLLGAIDLIALAVFAFACVKKFQCRNAS